MALAGWRATSGEDMAEMAAAAAAMFLRPEDPARQVAAIADGVWKRLPEARPAGAAVKFGGRAEQGQGAAGAGEDAPAMFVQKRAGGGPLGPCLAQAMVTLRSKAAAPVGGAMLDFECRRSPAARRHQAKTRNHP